MPPPPLDLVVRPGVVLAPPPHYATTTRPRPTWTSAAPRASTTFVPGDALLGVKLRLADGGGGEPALAVAAEVKLPLTRDRAGLALRLGHGRGGRAAARAWRSGGAGPHAWLATAAYTHTACRRAGDRVRAGRCRRAVRCEVPAAGARSGTASCSALARAAALGARWPRCVEASPSWRWAATPPTLDAATPFDVLGGVQARAGGGASGRAALPRPRAALGRAAASPVGGLVDVSRRGRRGSWPTLARLGAGAASPHLRAGSHRLVATRARARTLPPGARVLAAEYTIRSEHQLRLRDRAGLVVLSPVIARTRLRGWPQA